MLTMLIQIGSGEMDANDYLGGDNEKEGCLITFSKINTCDASSQLLCVHQNGKLIQINMET